jgi:hypothetical protein
VDNGDYSAEECKGDDVFDCFLAAGKEDDLDKREEKCKEKQ